MFFFDYLALSLKANNSHICFSNWEIRTSQYWHFTFSTKVHFRWSSNQLSIMNKRKTRKKERREKKKFSFWSISLLTNRSSTLDQINFLFTLSLSWEYTYMGLMFLFKKYPLMKQYSQITKKNVRMYLYINAYRLHL